MFKYATSVSELAHGVIKNYCCKFDVAVDATLGNGHDTDFLKQLFSKVYSFDIQKEAVENYKNKENNKNVVVIHDSHEFLNKYVKEEIDCVIYNLGYLPGANKNITTLSESTVKSVKQSLELLDTNGIIALCIYWGHDEGKKEKDSVINLVKQLPKNKYGVIMHTFLNRNNNPPILIVIEKK
ncbi:tRNA (mnm(5)s(2)U34)-methyltransferase [Haloimpatiens sp. FM7330]|uniref:tRNA (mnm(5)s(2)U34)-methyltransferase n=1 Tax=Haloimpatiens sp. FM7330 TaxID=3298610 RepID=UPI00363F4B93